jgi:hypothetical protein
MELETSDRLRGYWQDTQTKLNAAIRERDEARAELALLGSAADKLRIAHREEVHNLLAASDEARYERDNAQRAFNGMLRAYGELRAAIEAHNARFTTTESDRIPLPPAAKENSDE